MNTDSISRLVAGLAVSHVAEASGGALLIHFDNGAYLLVEALGDCLSVKFRSESRKGPPASRGQPSARQREYLQFIVRYLARYGVSPAERDIQQHFMVSAPSVNQMMKTLERRRFIARAHDFTGQAIPRSIRVLVDLE